MEIKARESGRETNIARDEAECFYFHIVQAYSGALTGLECFLVVLLGAFVS